jgi:Flp pilus assembly protein TadD
LTGNILAEYPRNGDTLHNRAILLFEAGSSAEAMETARTMIKTHPGDSRGYVDLGIMLARGGDPGQARAVFEEGLLAVGDDPVLRQNIETLDRKK